MFKFFASLFSTIGNYFRKMFAKAKEFLKKEIPTAIAVVDQIKIFVDSPFLPLITSLIPGTVDDVIAAKIKEALPKVVAQLKISNECSNKGTNDEIVQCFITHLKTLAPNARAGYYLTIASMLSADLTDNKLSWNEIVHAVQWAYDHRND